MDRRETAIPTRLHDVRLRSGLLTAGSDEYAKPIVMSADALIRVGVIRGYKGMSNYLDHIRTLEELHGVIDRHRDPAQRGALICT